MAVNIEKAEETGANGYAITNDDGTVLLYIAAGVGSPVGQQAPVPTLYMQDNAVLWVKDGATVNDWSQVSTGPGDNNIDGGFSLSTYLPDQCFDGGAA